MFKKTGRLVLDVLFPPLCLACDGYLNDSQSKICLNCLAAIPLYHYIVCPVCLARTPDTDEKPACHPDARYLLAAASHYDNPAIKALIKQLKYHGWQGLADELARLAIGIISARNMADFVVLPIPLHPARQRERGFNQAELLAIKIARKLNLPIINQNLIRIKDTGAQARTADWRAREENVRNSFSVVRYEDARGKNILLIDDVFTSGATLNEAARVLKLAGAKKIIALVAARAR